MNLLIIDDSRADHEIAADYLQESGGKYHFYHAYNAEEGLTLCRQQVIDCVLLDYHMPDKDGLEVLRQLSREHRTIPVVMMTGEGDESVAVAAMKLGSEDYIPKKTLTPSALKRAVRRAVEHTQLVEKMEQYRRELERSNRDLEQFANIVAHDLKLPLRAVTQHLSLIRERSPGQLDERSLRSLEFAVEGAARMRLLIEALFDYARLGFSEPSFDTVNMETVLGHTTRDLAAVIEERGATITHDVLPEVHGDAVLLAQLLQNLIANAMKYCTAKPTIHVSATRENDSWRISVKDNGIGIPAAQHEKIFAIFRRLHQEDEYPGIGLGLAICDRIVKLHGGRIEVQSEERQGALFCFTLPQPAAMSIPSRQASYG